MAVAWRYEEGLLSAQKTKVERGKQLFPCHHVVPPLWLCGPLPFGLYPHAPSLFHTAIALTFLLCLVPAFFFFALHLEPLQDNVNCDITVTATSPSTHTGHTPSSLPPTPSLPPQHRCYFTNPIAVTTTATPPLTLTLTCIAWHKNHPAAVVLTVPGAT